MRDGLGVVLEHDHVRHGSEKAGPECNQCASKILTWHNASSITPESSYYFCRCLFRQSVGADTMRFLDAHMYRFPGLCPVLSGDAEPQSFDHLLSQPPGCVTIAAAQLQCQLVYVHLRHVRRRGTCLSNRLLATPSHTCSSLFVL